MTYGGVPYAGGTYAGGDLAVADVPVDTEPHYAVEVSFTTNALEEPAWVDITGDVRWWDVSRGRAGELERFGPGRATVVLSNAARQYDSRHGTGPWFGNLRPNRRIRVRATFNGTTYPVFDGFVDRWALDYPGVGKDATATVTATDGSKVFARTKLPPSVYQTTVEDDSPAIWYRLDDNQVQQGDVAAVALNSGTLGTAADGTFVGPPELGAQSLIVHDPGTAMKVTNSIFNPGTTELGVRLPQASFDVMASPSWAVELWVRPEAEADAMEFFIPWINEHASLAGGEALVWYEGTSGGRFQFEIRTVAPATFEAVSAGGKAVHGRYHIVAKHGPNRVMSLYVNGVKVTGDTTTGALTAGDQFFGYQIGADARNWPGTIDEIAIYTSALAADPLTDAQVAAHYAAGTSPWQGDLPGERADRVLDEALWPDGLRELDDGETTFQSAAISGQSALEHLHKVAESEAGNLYLNRAGFVRLVERDVLLLRTPVAVFGDLAPEIGYRHVAFDDGFDSVRNRVTISRLNGVAKTAESSASIAEFGHMDFVLDGLLHDTDAHSLAYAGFIRDNYPDPVRRVVALELGPPAPGAEATLYPQMLGRELGDMITVKHRPPGGGDPFVQDVVIEGISIQGSPKVLTATWTLAPAPGGIF